MRFFVINPFYVAMLSSLWQQIRLIMLFFLHVLSPIWCLVVTTISYSSNLNNFNCILIAVIKQYTKYPFRHEYIFAEFYALLSGKMLSKKYFFLCKENYIRMSEIMQQHSHQGELAAVWREHEHNMELNSELSEISQDNYIFFQDSMTLYIR